MDASHDTIRSQIAALVSRLRRFALSVTGNRADADDLVQDTLERALRHLDQWQHGTRLDSWMFRIAQNLFIDSRRAARRKRAVFVDTDATQADAGYDGERAAEAQIVWRETCSALLTLPQDQRSAIALVLIDGMSYRDAADVLGVPIGTLTSRLARGREVLAEKILGSGAELHR